MKKISIGINGIDYSYGNLGCQALAYSILQIIRDCEKKLNIEIDYYLYFFKKDDKEIKKISEYFNIKEDRIHVTILSFSRIKSILNLKKSFKKCDVIIDMSGGDSFSDIYGVKRLIKESLCKKIAINNKIPLILGPQTYGPYKKYISRVIVKNILKKATLVFSRDEDSTALVKKMGRKNCITTTDVALRLPYETQIIRKNTIGINVSALMWYSEKSNYELKMDYKQYIEELITYLKSETKFEICLVAHVLSNGIKSEDDYLLCKELSDKYNIKLAPIFQDPIEAKNFISSLELFIGSRMHATIAAFSSNVPTIPVAYSKKFEGLFKSLNYNCIIDARKNNNTEAIEITKEYINSIEQLKINNNNSIKLVEERLKILDNELEKFIDGVVNKK